MSSFWASLARKLLFAAVTAAALGGLYAAAQAPAGAPAGVAPAQTETSPDFSALRQLTQRLASGPPAIRTTGTHAFAFRGTTRGAYQEIARQFGLTATFDMDLLDRQIDFNVPAADFETAMRELSDLSGTFWVAIDNQKFFVAADTTAKRRDFDPEIQQTVVLPESESDDEMTETSRMIRDIAGLRNTELDLKTHTLTLRDTPKNVALAKALVEEVEKPHGEFLLEIDVLEVDRDAARNLGITPPTSAQTFSLSTADIRELEQAQNSGTLAQAIESIFGSINPTAAAAGSSLIPPLIAFGGGSTTFLATLPNTSATFLQTLSAMRTAQRVLLRMEDGKPASLFVGQHYPVTLALLSESLIGGTSTFAASIPAGTFPRTDFNTGNSPAGVVSADFNGDAKLDLAVTNQMDNTVSILLGNGDGTFAGHVDYATGNGPSAIAVGDFNRDGKLDLAITNQTDDTVSILLGNGDGTFGAPVNLSAGAEPLSLVVGDFNKDGNSDLAVANEADNTISILLGNGDGTFGAQRKFLIGSGPAALAVADFNKDGNLDLAVANSNDNTFSLLFGKGDGTFSTRTDFQTGVGPSAATEGDFNNDGNPDLAVANKADNTISVFLGKGDGTFLAAPVLAAGTNPTALVTGNFSPDTIPDLVSVNQGDDTVSIFLGVGDGTFTTPLTIATANAPVAATSGDFNGDSLFDLAVVDKTSSLVSVILNTANLPASSTAPLTPYPGSEYVDLGLTVHAVPHVHPNGEVTLELQFEINQLAGTNVNGIPILANRAIQQSVRLRENETSVLAGINESTDAATTSGWPWLADAPGPLSYITGVHTKQQSDTEMLIAITPRQLRLADRKTSVIYAGRGDNAPAVPIGPGAPFPNAAPGAGVVPNAPPVPPAQPPAAPGVPPQQNVPGQPAPNPNAPNQTPNQTPNQAPNQAVPGQPGVAPDQSAPQ